MGVAFLYGNGGSGGGAGLNFKVVGNPQPASASENTIWIDTDTEITSWIFSATEPETPSEGMVWIATGTASTVAFNALKKNGVMVYPLSSKQYIGGAWIDKISKSHQDGAWVEWLIDFILVDTDGVRSGYTKSGATNTTCTVNSNNIVVKYAGGNGATSRFSWANITDVTEYGVMEITLTGVSFNGSSTYINCYVSSGATVKVTKNGTYELDISQVSGIQTIGFDSLGASFIVTDWRLKH